MKKDVFLSIPKDVTHGRGYVYSLRYHIVWCTKYRKQIFVSGLEEEVKKHLQEIAVSLQTKIIAMDVMPDAIKIFKGNTARWLFLAHPELKRQLWGGHMWNPSYFIATVSDRSMEQVERYILEQRTK